MALQKEQPQQPTAWGTSNWCEAAEIGRTTLYRIPKKDWPLHTRIGKKLRIIEAPTDYLRRIAEQGGVQTVPAKSG